MAIYLGSTNISTIYLGEAGYALPNVDAVYLGATKVWPGVGDVTISGITDMSVVALNGEYNFLYVDGTGRNVYATADDTRLLMFSYYQWRLGFRDTDLPSTDEIDTGYYFFNTFEEGASVVSPAARPPTTGWQTYAVTGSFTLTYND